MNLPFRQPRTVLLVRMAKCEMSCSVFTVAGDNLGIDHERLTFMFQGRHYRLTDVEGEVVEPLLA
jgi:hypothetical protein